MTLETMSKTMATKTSMEVETMTSKMTMAKISSMTMMDDDDNDDALTTMMG